MFTADLACPTVGQEPPLVRVTPPGPVSLAYAERLERVESPAFGARRASRSAVAGMDMAPIVYASARGSNVLDVDGNRHVDLAAGFGALLLGHRHPSVARALADQEERLWMALGDLYPSDAKVVLTERLAALYPGKGARVLLGQSGSDAVGAALKTAKLATGRPGVLAFHGAYHGLGYGPLAVCGFQPSWRQAFADQLNAHVRFAPYPASAPEGARVLAELRATLAAGEIGAILIEPILGRGGCIVPPTGFLAEVRALCTQAGALLIADEIWTGLGRSGNMLASCDAGVTPDLVCLGKGLGGGLPISACVGSDDVMQSWRREPGQEVVHTATFHGAPLACRTALATLDTLRDLELAARAARLGAEMRAELASALAGVPGFAEVRGQGLMIGVALHGAGSGLMLHRALLAAGYITTLGGRAGDVIVLTPALDIAPELLTGFTVALRRALEQRKAP
jgi:4-aminobutyrate aminotransferase-like enzyme